MKWSTITWVSQMCALVIFPDNGGTNPGWADWSWSTKTSDPGLLSVSFLMEPYLLPFVIYYLLLAVTSMDDTQRSTSSFKSINLDGMTSSFSILNMDLGWRWDNLSYQDLNSCLKGDSTPGNIIFSIFLVWYSLINLFNPMRKLE